jgi:hypothetical protein
VKSRKVAIVRDDDATRGCGKFEMREVARA